MNPLTDNVIATMYGPEFLAFYALVAAAAIAWCHFTLRAADGDGDRPPPVPARPNPYEIAYLRDGAAGAIRLAIYALCRQDRVDLSPKGALSKTPAATPPADPYEAQAFREINSGATVRTLLHSANLRAAFASLATGSQSRLRRDGLLAEPEERRRALGIGAATAALLIALAVYKIAIATHHGRHNVGFLIVEAIVANLIVLKIVSRHAISTANARGRLFLRQVGAAYRGRMGGPGSGAAALDANTDVIALAALAAMGFATLKDPRYAALRPAASTGDGSGGGDGGGGCGGGGGGCGGCGS